MFYKSGNTRGLDLHRVKLTFWDRAAASVGTMEAWRHSDGFYAQFIFWGWMISITCPLQRRVGYYRTLWHVNLPWARYNQNHGGVFCWDWLQEVQRRVNNIRSFNAWNADRQFTIVDEFGHYNCIDE